MKKINLASDNYSGVHPEIMHAIIAANVDVVPAYGSDEYTARAEEKFRRLFGSDADVFFVFNGTAANVMSIAAMCRSYQAVICVDSAHIQMDECGAPEKFTGSKLMTVPAVQGKLTLENIDKCLQRVGDQHAVQPAVISISQSTEYGTVYSVDEIRAIADYAHRHHMFLHVDGARISNAVASLNVDIRQVTKDAGVDVLCFGGTKNGMMFGEAVVFFNRELARNFQFIRKQGMQLASKMRFISAQFDAMLENDLWRHNAAHANKMAALLSAKLAKVKGITITQSAQANAVYAIIPPQYVAALQEKCHFYLWNERISEARLMTSFATTEEEVTTFVELVKAALI